MERTTKKLHSTIVRPVVDPTIKGHPTNSQLSGLSFLREEYKYRVQNPTEVVFRFFRKKGTTGGDHSTRESEVEIITTTIRLD